MHASYAGALMKGWDRGFSASRRVLEVNVSPAGLPRTKRIAVRIF